MRDTVMSPGTSVLASDDAQVTVTVYADVAGRLVAFGLDAVLLTLASFALLAGLHILLGPTVRFDGLGILRGRAIVDISRMVVDAIAVTLFSASYFALTWRALGGSPGQRVLSIRVRQVDGRPLSLSRALVRWAVRGGPLALIAIFAGLVAPVLQLSIDAIAVTWLLIVFLSIAGSATRRGVHDHVAGSVVTRSARAAGAETG
jgi:uncharacterized RDD family membrane protein YckC